MRCFKRRWTNKKMIMKTILAEFRGKKRVGRIVERILFIPWIKREMEGERGERVVGGLVSPAVPVA